MLKNRTVPSLLARHFDKRKTVLEVVSLRDFNWGVRGGGCDISDVQNLLHGNPRRQEILTRERPSFSFCNP